MAKFMKNLNLISRSAEMYRDKMLAPIDISGTQSKYFLQICSNPGISQEELSKAILVNKSNVARQIDILEKKGFILRKTNENDRRSLLLYPTQKMLDALPFVREVHSTWRELVTSGFSDDEKKMLSTLSDKLLKNALDILENER